MFQRTITGILLLLYTFGLLIGGVWAPVCVDILILSFMLVGVFEILKSLKKGGYKPYEWLCWLFAVGAFPLIHYFSFKGYLLLFSCALFASMIVFVIKFSGDKEKDFKDFLVTLLAMVYPTGLVSLLLLMNTKINAVYASVTVVVIAIFADMFAYFVGSTLKGKKLCPNISPKKTISGAIGGVIGGIIGAVCIYLVFDYSGWLSSLQGIPSMHLNVGASVGIYIAIGFFGAILSQFGDLFASRIKRVLGVKDFGNIFPGHGGSLDRLDSIMFVIILLFIALLSLGLL